jgi:V/A-type H+-transporting ATPase subunit E
MSITIDDKIERFSKLIFGNIEAHSSDKRQTLEETHNKELEALKAEIEKRKKELIDSAITRAERERVKLLAQARNQQQQLLVQQKQQMIQRVMNRIQELALAYTDTEAYRKYLEKNISLAISALDKSKHITFYAVEKDLQLCSQVLDKIIKASSQNIKFDVKKAANNIIGGIIAEDTVDLLQLDLTLKTAIDEFKDKVGAAITRRYNEVSSL